MASDWPALPFEEWRATCDTLHLHTQVIGKLASVLAPPEPQFQHVALRLTARGWETRPLPAPDGSGALGLAVDLHRHEVVLQHSDGRGEQVALTPNRSVGAVTREVLAAVARLGGSVELNLKPSEVPWTEPLDEDETHATYDPAQVATYFAAVTRAGDVLAALRAPYLGRSTPVNAWWGSFDVAVSLFSGAEEVAVGWWPGDDRYPRPAFYAYAQPLGDKLADVTLASGRWDSTLGEFVLDWDDCRATADPHATALEFGRSVGRHAGSALGWDAALRASIDGA